MDMKTWFPWIVGGALALASTHIAEAQRPSREREERSQSRESLPRRSESPMTGNGGGVSRERGIPESQFPTRGERSIPVRTDPPPSSRERDTRPIGEPVRTDRGTPVRTDPPPSSRERDSRPIGEPVRTDRGTPVRTDPPPSSRERDSRPSGEPVRTDRGIPVRTDPPPSTRGSDSRPVGEPASRDRIWEDRPSFEPSRSRDRVWDDRDSVGRGESRGRLQPQYEVRDRGTWRSGTAARSRDTIVLRDSRPPGRPGFIWWSGSSFYGFWGDRTCAPWFFTPGITVVSSAWCPFNSRIAYVELYGPVRRLQIYDSTWGAPRRFLGDGWDFVDQLSWSPDGRYLAFVGRRFGDDGLYLLDTLTGQVDRIARGFDRCGAPAWHPSGRSLFFLGNRFGSRRLYQIDPWDGFAQPCENIPYGEINRILVSPDGRGLVLGIASTGGWTEIWDVDLVRSVSPRPLLRLQGPFDQPCFSGDGRRIHFVQPGRDGVSMFSFERTGADLRIHADPFR